MVVILTPIVLRVVGIPGIFYKKRGWNLGMNQRTESYHEIMNPNLTPPNVYINFSGFL